MSTTLQLRRGTTANHSAFVGADGEVTVDTTLKNIRIHDGVTPGGTLAGGGAADVAGAIVAAPAKATPVDADSIGIVDSAASNVLKETTLGQLKTWLLAAWRDVTGGLVGLTGFSINFKNAAGTFTSLMANTNTAIRTYTFQDASGTVAFLSDIGGGGGGGGRLAPNFANSSTQVAQRAGATINLSTSRQIGQVDNVVIWASGGTVSAGTLSQITSAISGSTGYAARAAGVTLTGSGVISHSIQLEARDAVKYKNKTVSFSVKVDHDVGSSVNYTLVVKKPTVSDTFGAQSTIATSSATAVATATATTLTFDAVSVGDCSNGLVLEVQAACGAVTTKNFNCTEFNVDIAATAPAYSAPDVDTELARSQRYYYRISPVAGEILAHASASTTTNSAALIPFPVKMRVAPSAIQQSGTPGDYTVIYGVASAACSAVPTYSIAGTVSCRAIFPIASGLTAAMITEIQATNTSGYIGFTGAELI